MIGEFNFHGLYFPPLLLLALLTLLLSRLLNRVLARTGLYRFVWHPALFDFCLFVAMLGALSSLTSSLTFH